MKSVHKTHISTGLKIHVECPQTALNYTFLFTLFIYNLRAANGVMRWSICGEVALPAACVL